MTTRSDNKVRRLFILGWVMLGLAGCASQPALQSGVSPGLSDEPGSTSAIDLGMVDTARRVAIIPGQIRYVVKEGDSLWDIASRFLYDPWRWREVWRGNPGLNNPDRIYPGDTLVLTQKEGVTRISVSQRALPIFRLSPQVRTQPLQLESVPTVDKLVLDKFLIQARIIDEASLQRLPYVLGGAERRLLGGTHGDEIYVMGLKASRQTAYGIYRKTRRVKDGRGRSIGYQLVRVAEARLLQQGKPSRFHILSSTDAVKKGDRLLPLEDDKALRFIPRPAPKFRHGRIISVFGGINMIGQYNSVTLDLGIRDGIEPGHVLGVFQKRARYRDPQTGDWVKAYDRRAGILMVYTSYDKVSHALVMSAQHPLRVDDVVGRP